MDKNKNLGCVAIGIQVKIDKIDSHDKTNKSGQFL